VLEPVEMGIFAGTQLGGFYFEVELKLRLEVVPDMRLEVVLELLGMRLEAGPSQVDSSLIGP